MPGWHGEAPGRRVGVVVLLVSLLATAAAVAALGLLRPPSGPVADPGAEGADLCERPAPAGRAPLVRSGTLLACPVQLDGAIVRIEGEAVGDVLRGPGGRRWVQVNDDAYARVGQLREHGATLGANSGVAILLPVGFEPAVLGGPGVRGDRLAVVGEWQATSPADQGGPAIVAREVAVLDRGGPVALPAATRLRAAAVIAVLVTAALGGAVLRRRRRLAA